MREIKFRVWLPLTKEMISTVLVGGDQIAIIGVQHKGKSIDGYKIMQYTGIKDKNGNEIYEGDIVLNTFNSMYGKEIKREVVTYNNGYHFSNAGVHTIKQTLEIIGNIYENTL